ncbi:MAG: addiction module protein [Bacteroidetes bacterium]|nr:addiction module protein [Bacteroidota bacterium]MBU1720068.1 addiction module protein [Bacteroidota bacterium]
MDIKYFQSLSVAERILWTEKIWESIEKDEIVISDKQKQEIQHRYEMFKKGKTKFHSWEDIKSSLRFSE